VVDIHFDEYSRISMLTDHGFLVHRNLASQLYRTEAATAFLNFF